MKLGRHKELWVRLLGGVLTTLALALVLLVYGWLMTDGTGALKGYEFLGDAYDELALSLIQGRCDVVAGWISHEGIKVGERTVMYFGPWPSLLRVVGLAVWPEMDRFYSRSSCLLAALICLAALIWLTRRALAAAPGLSPLARSLTLPLITLAYGLGTPLLHLMTTGRIYHEAILWGLAGALICLAAVTALLRGWVRPLPALTVASVAAGVAILARLTFGVASLLLMGVAVVRLLQRREPRAWVLAACLPALAAVGYQAWYNDCRFGSPLKTIHYPGFYFDPASFGGELNPRRIPYTLRSYFGVEREHFSATPPHVQGIYPAELPRDLYRDFFAKSFSLTLSSSWLLAGALMGLWVVARLRLGWAHLVCLGVLSLQWGLILCFHHRTMRYQAEMLPALVFLLTAALSRPAVGGAARRLRQGVMVLLVLISITLNSAATLHMLADSSQAVGEVFSAKVQRWLGRGPPRE